MFADKIAESSSTTGTGTFSLAGAVGAYRTWRTGFSTNTVVFYLASNSTGTIWEIGYGSFATGSPACSCVYVVQLVAIDSELQHRMI